MIILYPVRELHFLSLFVFLIILTSPGYAGRTLPVRAEWDERQQTGVPRPNNGSRVNPSYLS